MVSTDGKAYSQQPYAFRYRKEYIKGCSCKVSEYNPEEIAGHGKKTEDGKQKSGAAPAQGGTAAKVAKDASDTTKQQ